MRRLLLHCLLALGFLATASPADAGTDCFGVPTDPSYLAAFDTAGGQPRDGLVMYPQGRWLQEWQTWATPPFQMPGHHSEHIHVAACIPNGQTLTAPFRLDVHVTFFNMRDYTVRQAGMSAVTKTGSRSLWQATATQLAGLDAAMKAAVPGAGPQRYSFSVTVTPPTTNGFKEIRGALRVDASGPDAVFVSWQMDPRWYETDKYAGLVASEPLTSQRAIRVRPIMTFPRLSDGQLTTAYHHAGFCQPGDTTTDTGSDTWTRATVAAPWPATKKVCLYDTDGGGRFFLEVDPDHHSHDPSSPDGENHGIWHITGDLLAGGPTPRLVTYSVPVSTLGLAPGSLHRLVFVSDDFPDCAGRMGTTWSKCPLGTRGSWTNVNVLPFRTG